ncbi:MAG: minor capsid protein [Sphaerochaeta sp.]
MTCDVKFDRAGIDRKVLKGRKRALAATASEFERLTEPYVRYLSGDTSRSSKTASRFDDGLVIYDTSYAAYAYYNNESNITIDTHPLACVKWGEVSKAKHMKHYKDTFEKALKGEI